MTTNITFARRAPRDVLISAGLKGHSSSVLWTIVAAWAIGVWANGACVRADVPAPPVNQTIGVPDVASGAFEEADCRVCHDSGVPDRHHTLYGQPIPEGSVVPYPDADGDGNPDTTYGCLNCHGDTFAIERDCVVCHTSTAHHTTPAAQAGDCVYCHGDIVDNMDDGHYIPTYEPSLVTPATSLEPGEAGGEPLNSRGIAAGACNYCHDDDGLAEPVILTNADLHHSTRFGFDGVGLCTWCHDVHDPLNIRTCEGCHGPDSLHNIQADSPNANNPGSVVVGGEDAGYGHVGRDAGPGDSDCWGCHGFSMAAAPGSGPLIPSLYYADRAIVPSGTDTMVVLTGAAFVNYIGDTAFESDVALTAADGTSVTLTPDIILDQGEMAVTIPGGTAPGNYRLQAVKSGFASNPAVISVVPKAVISEATSSGSVVTINGSGLGGYAQGAGTSVTGTITTGKGKKNRTTTTVEGTIVSWTDTLIQAEFASRPDEVTINSVFGTATSAVDGRRPSKPPKHTKRKGPKK